MHTYKLYGPGLVICMTFMGNDKQLCIIHHFLQRRAFALMEFPLVRATPLPHIYTGIAGQLSTKSEILKVSLECALTSNYEAKYKKFHIV